MTEHEKKAGELFLSGYNCAQSVLIAFSDATGLEPQTAARLASSFGGGIGRMREVCGAVSGAAMALGLLRGYGDPNDPEAKSGHYRLIREFARRFKEEIGSIICRELLADVETAPGGEPEARTAAYYKKRPCADCVRCAARLADEMLCASDAEK